jgi:hypothetical protein
MKPGQVTRITSTGFGDYRETRAVLAIAGLAIITTLIWRHFMGEASFSACFGVIFACYTAHSVLDDKIPDANLPQVSVQVNNGT